MKMKAQEAQELPEDVELLLPWYATGTVSRRDAARLQKALANDKELARRYELVREELGEVIRLNELLGAPSGRPLQKLLAKIDAEPICKPRTSFNLTVWLTRFVAGLSPHTLAYGSAAAAFVIVMQAGILADMFIKAGAPGPKLASYEKTTKVREGAFVLIQFKPEATVTDITKFLEENQATVVKGPAGDRGLYWVRLAGKPLSQAEFAAVVTKMASSPVASFTVPAARP
jgi:hypothetical protein